LRSHRALLRLAELWTAGTKARLPLGTWVLRATSASRLKALLVQTLMSGGR
jgi:hypothetical protein